MGYFDPSFKAVKAHGNIGDRGNDGWCEDRGEYYQVYAPDDLSKNNANAIKKMKEDFIKLKSYWDRISPIKTYIFVVNDKYMGIPPHISDALNDIKKENSLDAVRVMSAKDLERKLFSLNIDIISSIVGHSIDVKGNINDRVFNFWYKGIDANNLTYNSNYLPHNTHNVKFTRNFINKLKYYCLNVYEFLNERSSNLADTALICALMDFKTVAIDVIRACEEYEGKLDINSGLIMYWVDGDHDYDYIVYKKYVVKSLFYYLIKASNYVINVRINIENDFKDINYVAYHSDFYPNYPILGDSEPSPAEFIGRSEKDAYYPGLDIVEEGISSQIFNKS